MSPASCGWTPTRRSSACSARRGACCALASYEHSYPHCWRCRNPLIYKAVSSWFVRVTDIKDRLHREQRADHLGARERQARPVRQVARGRARLVDQPQPLLGLADPGVEERRPGAPARRRVRLARGARARLRPPAAQRRGRGRPAPAVHRRPHPPEPRRPDRPQHHAPHRGRPRRVVRLRRRCRTRRCTTRSRTSEWFDEHSPADFIVEYIGQTRGWFYVMHVLSTALFDRPAFTGVSCHGIVLGSDGLKMSKSLQNYPDVSEVFDRDGSDAMRWFLMSSSRAARRQPHRHRGGDPRRGARVHAAAVERVVLLRDLRQRFADRLRDRRRGLSRPRGAPIRPTCSIATSSRSPAISCGMSPPTSRGSTRRWPRRSCATSPRR